MKSSSLTTLLFCLLANLSLNSQENLVHIENYILKGQKDSAALIMKDASIEGKYNSVLKDLIQIDEQLLSSISVFVKRMNSKATVSYRRLNDFIENTVEQPSSKATIDLNYVEIKWYQITNLRNETHLSESNDLHQELENYILQFNQEDPIVIKAKVLADSHR